ncbi:hypothetical protein [Sebaldella sp. S0638]|uniref:hypothetical protein n=1 Tax=Sebaldella sp. S0638 TaxID=2957809 RepID=UPI00209D02EA|nr:hypothetical protein [Sebaldella sp. S0638]MCP1224688.1 hypothetical protein [Sebaldella sp. S0638]
MGFGKILKCKSCGSEYDMCLGESGEGETETVLFCTICGSFGHKSDLTGKEIVCCGKPMEQITEFGDLDKRIKKFRCPECGKRDIMDTGELFSWE